MSKLLYKNNVGKLYDDKVVVLKEKFQIKSIKDIDLIYFQDTRLNIIFFTIGVSGLFVSIFLFKLKILNIFFVVFFLFFLFLSIIFKGRSYYLKIMLDESEKIIKVKRSDVEVLKQLIKEYTTYTRKHKT